MFVPSKSVSFESGEQTWETTAFSAFALIKQHLTISISVRPCLRQLLTFTQDIWGWNIFNVESISCNRSFMVWYDVSRLWDVLYYDNFQKWSAVFQRGLLVNATWWQLDYHSKTVDILFSGNYLSMATDVSTSLQLYDILDELANDFAEVVEVIDAKWWDCFVVVEVLEVVADYPGSFLSPTYCHTQLMPLVQIPLLDFWSFRLSKGLKICLQLEYELPNSSLPGDNLKTRPLCSSAVKEGECNLLDMHDRSDVGLIAFEN